MGRRDRITTVGIDVGTSTTKLVISELKVANTAGRTRVPRLEIVERRVVYRSPLYRTPLLNERLIDIPGVWSIVEQEYRRAGVSMREVDTGAVIITGETANKENAREMVVSLAHRAGDFVVATAGPDLEGILAGKGSGAWQWSKKTGRTIANVDIGGGTANIAVFSGGEVSGTCTLHIGGRMVEFAGGTIARISPPLVEWMRMEGLSLDVGQRVDGEVVDMLRKITDGLARSLAAVLRGEVGLAEEPLFVNHPPNWADPPDCVMFSGGVGGMMEELTRSRAVSDYAALVWDRVKAGDGFADIGVPLAHSLLASPELSVFERIPPQEAMRATVIGAGAQSLEVSGATIHIEPHLLPLRNVPVLSFTYDEAGQSDEALRRVLTQGQQMYDPLGEGQTYALAVKGLSRMHFVDLQRAAHMFAGVLQEFVSEEKPVVIIVDGDAGKAFGQCLTAAGLKRLICIDQISVEHGDYVDIGEPLADGEAVPVMIKTLVLDSPREEIRQ